MGDFNFSPILTGCPKIRASFANGQIIAGASNSKVELPSHLTGLKNSPAGIPAIYFKGALLFMQAQRVQVEAVNG